MKEDRNINSQAGLALGPESGLFSCPSHDVK